MKYLRFNLTTMLAVTGLIGIPLGYLSQTGFVEAQFVVLFNELQVDDRGVLSGDMACECSIPGAPPTKMICSIEQSHLTDLQQIAADTRWSVRYRWDPPFGLFPKQDAYGIFLTTKLGFAAEDVVGQVKDKDKSVVLIRQKL